jgi:MFS family permease
VTSATPVTQPKIAAIGRALVPLLAVAVFINYVDRGNLATAAPLIKDELRFSSTQIGVLLSAFFWSYVPAQVLAGWLAERINPYRTRALGLAIWSAATACAELQPGLLRSLRCACCWVLVRVQRFRAARSYWRSICRPISSGAQTG